MAAVVSVILSAALKRSRASARKRSSPVAHSSASAAFLYARFATAPGCTENGSPAGVSLSFSTCANESGWLTVSQHRLTFQPAQERVTADSICILMVVHRAWQPP